MYLYFRPDHTGYASCPSENGMGMSGISWHLLSTWSPMNRPYREWSGVYYLLFTFTMDLITHEPVLSGWSECVWHFMTFIVDLITHERDNSMKFLSSGFFSWINSTYLGPKVTPQNIFKNIFVFGEIFTRFFCSNFRKTILGDRLIAGYRYPKSIDLQVTIFLIFYVFSSVFLFWLSVDCRVLLPENWSIPMLK